MEELKISLLVVFLSLPILIVVYYIIGTFLHELWHAVAAKILKGKVSGIVWFNFKNFLKSFKSNDEFMMGGLYVHLPLEKERYRWIVNLAGGVGAGLILIVGGSLILAWVIKNHLLDFNSIGGLIGGLVGVMMIVASYIEIKTGINECRKKGFYQQSSK